MPEQNVSRKGREHKQKIIANVLELLKEHKIIFTVLCDNIGSSHMQSIRKGLRGNGTIIIGKNTLLRKAIRDNLEEYPQWESLLPLIRGNVGLVFTNGDMLDLKKRLMDSRVPAAAKVGMISTLDVWIPKGPTGLQPTMTSMFQALSITSKINKGQIEIQSNVLLIPNETIVNASQVNLLQVLDVKPFSYGLECVSVYDNGAIYDAKLLDVTEDEILAQFAAGVSTVAALSLETGVATLAAYPHAVLNAYKNLLAVALETDFVFDQAVELKEKILTGAFNTSTDAVVADDAQVEEEVEEEEEDESSSGGGMGMFGDESSSY